MKLTHICVENRMGHKMMINIMYANRLVYTNGNIPRLFIEVGCEPICILAGARMPSANYDPAKDTISVELIYDDGSTEKPYTKGHVDLEDLYNRLSHPEQIPVQQDIDA